MRRIGLTGGIGTGKSTVSNYISSRGYTIIDADRIAREVVEPGSPVLAELESAFGSGIIDDDGSLKRKALADIVFTDEAAMKKMNGIMHGAIISAMLDRADEAERAGEKAVFFDAPLLFETGMETMCDSVWLVVADDDVRIRRIMIRDGFTEAEVLERFASQMPDDEKKKRSDCLIDNSTTLESLYAQVDELLDVLETES